VLIDFLLLCVYTHIVMIHKSRIIDYREVPYCACFNSRKIARAITSYFDKKMSRAGINGTQFSLLAAVNYYQPVTVNKLAERLVMDRTTLSRNVNVLEKDGLCVSQPGHEDKRHREINLTSEGKNTLENAYPLWIEAQEQFYDFFDKKEWKENVSNFDEIINEI